MFTIDEIKEIAKRANESIAKDFKESGFKNPPVVTYGMVRAVLESARLENLLPDRGDDAGAVDNQVNA